MIYIIFLLLFLLIISILIIFNIFRKLEIQEEILIGYNEYLNKISKVIESSDITLKKLDEKGSFKSDDEIGFFFKSVQELQDILNNFKIKTM